MKKVEKLEQKTATERDGWKFWRVEARVLLRSYEGNGESLGKAR